MWSTTHNQNRSFAAEQLKGVAHVLRGVRTASGVCGCGSVEFDLDRRFAEILFPTTPNKRCRQMNTHTLRTHKQHAWNLSGEHVHFTNPCFRPRLFAAPEADAACKITQPALSLMSVCCDPIGPKMKDVTCVSATGRTARSSSSTISLSSTELSSLAVGRGR